MDRRLPGLDGGGVVTAGRPQRLPPQVQAWVDARSRYGLSHAHVTMARELGLNPRMLGHLANHRQEPWKTPLSMFIEDLYLKRFGRDRPEVVVRVEQQHRQKQQKKTAHPPARAAKPTAARRTSPGDHPSPP